ncbi:MAG: TonB family protein, partial [Pedosphaera sp.]|nr:TonB family protein [Pedosphaera sp.]
PQPVPQPPKPAPETLPPPPAPKPPTPKPDPTPEPPKVAHPDLPKPHVEKTHKEKPKPEPKEVETPTPKVTHKIVIPKDQLKATTRKVDDKAKAEQEAADASARAASRRAAHEFASTLKTISKNLSSKTPLVEMPSGPGGGGEVSVNYRDLIASKYYNAWIAPAGLDDDTPVVTASVTISRNGDVISAHITKSSGNALMDRSIQHVLEAVTFIEPFPASSHEQQRTVTIQFNLQAKRQIG